MRTQTARFATPLFAAIALLACGADTDPQSGSQPGSPSLVNVKQSACKQTSGDIHFGTGNLEAQVAHDGSLSILHKDASYNCAAKVKMEASVTGSTILVKEVLANPNDTMARCVCPYDLSADLTGLAAGTYQLKVTDTEGNLVGSTTVQIGAGASLPVDSIQSACKANPEAEYAAPAIRSAGEGSELQVTHENARYNCASKVEMKATLAGSEIIVKELITNPGELALCICDFDLSMTVKGLAPGSYTLKIFDADGQLVSTTQVAVR